MNKIMTSAEVRSRLMDAVELDLIGPSPGHPYVDEILPERPSNWYLSGFLAPSGVADGDEDDEDEVGGNLVENEDQEQTQEERAPRRRQPFPSSFGVTVITPPNCKILTVMVAWGEYQEQARDSQFQGIAEGPNSDLMWVRRQLETRIDVDLSSNRNEYTPANAPCLRLVISNELAPKEMTFKGHLPDGSRIVGIFLVNGAPRPTIRDDDTGFIFQAEMTVECKEGFVSRPNLKGRHSEDSEERIADLQYAHVKDYCVGHGIATEPLITENKCYLIKTRWMPRSDVKRVKPGIVANVPMGMEEIAGVKTAPELIQKLLPLVSQYKGWIESKNNTPGLTKEHQDTNRTLLKEAEHAAKRIEAGIQLLNEPLAFKAFQIANRAMAAAARQRFSFGRGISPADVDAPSWRPFQLAFILLNLRGIWDPTSPDRATVDLLFFPTGGGKTEAYLGLSAFAILLRRLRSPNVMSCGTSVLMRYTLRLLTLDQLGRATGLICALELERKKQPEYLGSWPFEIGLWVGRAATPNRLGKRGDDDKNSAYKWLGAFRKGERASPIPISDCPWCNTKIGDERDCFQLTGSAHEPSGLRVCCSNFDCPFSGANRAFLPVLSVDEEIYQRIPCFLIATVDKFASLPWVAQSGAILGLVDRCDDAGFYNSAIIQKGEKIGAKRLQGPDLIIQDELHLISGPLGTITGLFETAVEKLATSTDEAGNNYVPKVIASTATVRRFQEQIRALFGRENSSLFPPLGPDIRDSFFAQEDPHANPRTYVGIAAQGRSQKVVLRRTYLSLLSAAQALYLQNQQNKKDTKRVDRKPNPTDPYMTLLGYFNSLRELGGSRRIVEGEIHELVTKRASRVRLNKQDTLYANREIADEPVELTSRLGTAAVAESKSNLNVTFGNANQVDIALATNMISVGLDIPRLGLMTVLGQPKTTSEYIQTTSRVGRDDSRPGLVLCLYNIHKHRDRSHYEKFGVYHACFYRSVEPTSVTPFSPRALDKALASTIVAIVRHLNPSLTKENAAAAILYNPDALLLALEAISTRAANYKPFPEEDATQMRAFLSKRIADLGDKWQRIARHAIKETSGLEYGKSRTSTGIALLHDFLDTDLDTLPPEYAFFRANRSMRDVEATTGIFVKDLKGKIRD